MRHSLALALTLSVPALVASAVPDIHAGSGPLTWVRGKVTVVDKRVSKDETYYFGHQFRLFETGGSGEQGWKDGTYKHTGSSSCKAEWSLPPVLTPKTKTAIPFTMSIKAWQTGGYRNLKHWISLKLGHHFIGELKCEGPSNALPPPVDQPMIFDVPSGKKGDTMTLRLIYQTVGGAGAVDYTYELREYAGAPAAPVAPPTVAAPPATHGWLLESSTVAEQRVRKDEDYYFGHQFQLNATGGTGAMSWKDGTYKFTGSSACKATWSLPPSLEPKGKASVPVTMAIEARQTGGSRSLTHWLSLKVNGGLVGELRCQGDSTALPGRVNQTLTFDVPAGKEGTTLVVRVFYHTVGGAGAVDFLYRYKA